MPYPKKTLGDLTTFVASGITPRGGNATYVESGPQLVRSQNVLMGSLSLENVARINPEIFESMRRVRVLFDDVLLNITGASIGRVCRVAVDLGEAVVNQHVAIIRTHKDILSPAFLSYAMRTDRLQQTILSGQTGAAQGGFNHQKIRALEIPLPPIPEQARIVEILDQADALRQQRRQADALFRRILPALFHEMFGNLDTNSKGWQKESLAALTLIDAPFVSPLKSKYLDLPHIGPDSIEKSTGKLLQWRTAREDGLKSGKFLFDSSHVLYSKIRPNLRKVAIPEFEGLCSADVYPVRPSDSRTTREFLWALLLSDHFTDYTVTVSARANMPKVNREQFGAYQAIVPDQQSMLKFSCSVEKLLPLGQSWNSSATTLETLFQTLLHRAFDGSLTAKWREGHAKEVMQEMKHQAL